MDAGPWQPDPPKDEADRARQLELHRRAYLDAYMADRPDEAAYHLAEIERLERQ